MIARGQRHRVRLDVAVDERVRSRGVVCRARLVVVAGWKGEDVVAA
jgi:hypothetical protein